DDGPQVAGVVGLVRPAVAGAVVGADARERGDAPLQRRGADRTVAQPRLEHDGGAALAPAVKVQAAPTDVDELAGSGWEVRLGGGDGRSRQRGAHGDVAREMWQVHTVLPLRATTVADGHDADGSRGRPCLAA